MALNIYYTLIIYNKIRWDAKKSIDILIAVMYVLLLEVEFR